MPILFNFIFFIKFLAFPNLGSRTIANTQKILHPKTTVELGDVAGAKEIAHKLKDNKFYEECMLDTQKNFDKYYSEKRFVEHWNRVWKNKI